MKGPNFSPGEPARVLVMLDQPLVAEIVSFTLSHGAHDTRTVTNVEQATALFRDWRPHVAVLDMDIGGDRILEETQGPSGVRCSSDVPARILRLRMSISISPSLITGLRAGLLP